MSDFKYIIALYDGDIYIHKYVEKNKILSLKCPHPLITGIAEEIDNFVVTTFDNKKLKYLCTNNENIQVCIDDVKTELSFYGFITCCVMENVGEINYTYIGDIYNKKFKKIKECGRMIEFIIQSPTVH